MAKHASAQSTTDRNKRIVLISRLLIARAQHGRLQRRQSTTIDSLHYNRVDCGIEQTTKLPRELHAPSILGNKKVSVLLPVFVEKGICLLDSNLWRLNGGTIAAILAAHYNGIFAATHFPVSVEAPSWTSIFKKNCNKQIY